MFISPPIFPKACFNFSVHKHIEKYPMLSHFCSTSNPSIPETQRSKLFTWIENNYREISVEKTIRLEDIHTVKTAMWHYAPLRTQARGHLLWFTAWLAMRKTWINYSLCYCDGFLSSIYLLISTYYLYISPIYSHTYLYHPTWNIWQIQAHVKYICHTYIQIQILEDKWNNRS